MEKYVDLISLFFSSNLTLFKSQKGQSFGEKSLFSCSSWAVTGRCLENTSIIFMRKEEFLSVIKEFRNDYVCLIHLFQYLDGK